MQKNFENDFYDLAISKRMFSNKSNLKFFLDYMFDNIELKNKKILDVGGGAGLLTFYAGVRGSKKVICLEPEFDGSSPGMIRRFDEFKTALSPSLEVELLPVTLQAFTPQVKDEEFDIVMMQSSINHLDEEACINLRKDKKSYDTYKEIFTDVYNKMRKGGTLLITDCSCNNFFNSIGVKNMFAPTIEWHKHQAPGTWITLLKEVGFKNPKVEWKSPYRFGKAGKALMGNPLISYLYQSGFKFTMEK